MVVHHPHYYCASEEDPPVTFQVAVGAPNGWIMGSDTLESRFVGIASKRIRETTDTKKIMYDRSSNTTYMVAGDEIARKAASEIVLALRAFGTNNPSNEWLEAELPTIASKCWKRLKADELLPSPRNYFWLSKTFGLFGKCGLMKRQRLNAFIQRCSTAMRTIQQSFL
jgi:hypothetical protein